MPSSPKNGLCILSMPTVPLDDIEETPLESPVLVWHHDAHMFQWWSLAIDVSFPDDGQEQRACAVHDRDVWHEPIAIVIRELLYHTEKERMLGDRAHGVVADSRGSRYTKPSGIGQERVESPIAAVIKIDVYPPVVC